MCSIKTILNKAIKISTDQTLSQLSMKGLTSSLGSILSHVIDEVRDVEFFTKDNRPTKALVILALDIKDILGDKVDKDAVIGAIEAHKHATFYGLGDSYQDNKLTEEVIKVELVADMFNAIREVEAIEEGYAPTSMARTILAILYIISEATFESTSTLLEDVIRVIDEVPVVSAKDNNEETPEVIEEDKIREEEEELEEMNTAMEAIRDMEALLEDNKKLDLNTIVSAIDLGLYEGVSLEDVINKVADLLDSGVINRFKKDVEVALRAIERMNNESDVKELLVTILDNNDKLEFAKDLVKFEQKDIVVALEEIFDVNIEEETNDEYITRLLAIENDNDVMEMCYLSNYRNNVGSTLISKELHSNSVEVDSIDRIVMSEESDDKGLISVRNDKLRKGRIKSVSTKRITTKKSPSRLVSADMLEHIISLTAESRIVQGMMYFSKETNNFISVMPRYKEDNGILTVGYSNTGMKFDVVELFYAKEDETLLSRDISITQNLVHPCANYKALELPQTINHDGFTFELHAAISSSAEQQRLTNNTQGMTYINLGAFQGQSTQDRLELLQNHMLINTHGLTTLKNMTNSEKGLISGSQIKTIAPRLTPLSTASRTGKITGYVVYTMSKHKTNLKGMSGNDGISYLTNSARKQLNLQFGEGMQTRPLSAKALSTFVSKTVAVRYTNRLVKDDQQNTIVAYYEEGVVVDAVSVVESELKYFNAVNKKYRNHNEQEWAFLGSFDGNVLKYDFTVADVIGSKFEICSTFKLGAKGTDKLSYQVIDLLDIDKAWMCNAVARLKEVISTGYNTSTAKGEDLTIGDYNEYKERHTMLVKKIQETFKDGKVFVDPKLNKNAIIQPEIMGSLGFDIFQFLSDDLKEKVKAGYIPTFSNAFGKTAEGVSMRYPILAGEVARLLIIGEDDSKAIIKTAKKHVKAEMKNGNMEEREGKDLLAGLKDCEKHYRTDEFFSPLISAFMNLLGGWDTDKDALLISVDSMLVDNVREIKGTDSTFAETEIEKYKVATSKYFSSINMMMFQNKVMEETPSVGAITKNSEICTKMIRTLEDMIKYNNTKETPDGRVQLLKSEAIVTLQAFMDISENAYKNFRNEVLRTNTGAIAKAVIDTKTEENCLNQDVLISLDRVVDNGNKSTKKDVVKEVISYTQTINNKVKSLITACEQTYTDNDMLANIIETLKKIRSVYTFDQGAAIDIIKKNIKVEDNWINLFCEIKSNPKARVTKEESLINGVIETKLSRAVPNVRGNVDVVLNNLIYVINRDSLLSLDLTGHGKNKQIVESGEFNLNVIKKHNTISVEADIEAEDKYESFGYADGQYFEKYCYNVEHVLNLASSMYRNSYNHITQDMPIDAKFDERRNAEKAQTKENIELCRALLTSISKGVNHMEFTHALYAYASAQSKFARKMSTAPLSVNAQSDVKQTVTIKHAAKSPKANTIYDLEKGVSKEGFVFGTSAEKVIVKKEYETVYDMANGIEEVGYKEHDVAYVLGNASDSFNQDSEIEDVTVFRYNGNLDCTDKTQLSEALNEMIILNNIENAEKDDQGFYVHGELVTTDNVNVIEINQRSKNQLGEEVKTITGAYIIVKKMK